MKVLAVDPGYDRCGVALLVTETGGTGRLVASTTITSERGTPFTERLCVVAGEFATWIEKHKPDVCALETLYVTKNQKTAMRVAEVRGALLLTAAQRHLAVVEYGPGEVKVAVTGDGRATKQQVTLMVSRLVTIDHEVKYDDEYDAIAVGLTACAILQSPTADS